MSQLKRIAEEEFSMEMTPLIDVTFLLLIFFLLTIKFKILEGKLAAYLPKDVGVNTSPAEPKEKVEIRIDVKKEGTKLSPYLDGPYIPGKHERFEFQEGTRVLEYSIGPKTFKDLDKVQERLKELFKADKERPATIDCREGSVYGDMVPILDAAIEVGYRDITFVGEYKPTKKTAK